MTACHSGPCLNGGSCSPSPGGYSCTCPPSHTGPRCQTSTDHCASGECPPCPGAGPQEDGGTGQGVFVPCQKQLTGHSKVLFSLGAGGVVVCPVCGVTEVTGQVTGKEPNPSQPPLSSPVPQWGYLCEQAWHLLLPLCHWLPGPTL